MLFKKKKEELSDQLTVYQERKAPRWGTPQFNLKAGITIDGFEGEGQLGNISISGCSIKSVTYVNIIPDKIYNVKIIPEQSDNMSSFSIKMKLSWTKSNEELFLAGFSLDEGESSYQLKQYVEILRARGIEPDYGNMRPQS
ncbi:MAG: PilZ domain-containing protein [Treponema sp.]|nr:PilZ domain-containing protein [Treponema sp.]MCL2251389.1 PilZ domain-containing protein [Treponema sp.]